MSDSTAVVDQKALEAQMREQAAAMKAKIGAPGGDKIRLTKTKKFKLPNGVESAGPLSLVVVDFVAFNAYFDRPFSEKDKTPPACFALGAVKPVQLVASAASPVPQNAKNGGKCGIPKTPGCCWANEFGTKGGGKACGNHYLLGCVEANDNPSSPLYLLQLGPKTLRHWETYANGILLHTGFPPISVVTEIYFDPTEENQVLRFNKATPNNPNLGVHMARKEAVLQRLLAEPDVGGYTAPPKAGPR